MNDHNVFLGMTEGDMTAELVERDLVALTVDDLLQYARDALHAEYDRMDREGIRKLYHAAFLAGEYVPQRQYKVYRAKEASPTVYVYDDARELYAPLSPDTFFESPKIIFDIMEEGTFSYVVAPPGLELIGVLYKDSFKEVKQ